MGLASAAVSTYWLLGGRALLDTLGGALERQARTRDASALVVMCVVVALKMFASVLPLLVVGARMNDAWGRWLGRLSWVEAGVLTLYGLVYTAVGALALADVVHAPPGSNRHALAWHAYFWDQWFLVWGLLVVAALIRHRAEPGSTR